MKIEEMRVTIHGKVQMVMFRDFIQRKARTLGLKGTVANLSDRSVEVVAQGPRDALDILVEHLHKGPFLARVLKVDVQWRKPKNKFGGFSILY
jgi:acylphosphatase